MPLWKTLKRVHMFLFRYSYFSWYTRYVSMYERRQTLMIVWCNLEVLMFADEMKIYKPIRNMTIVCYQGTCSTFLYKALKIFDFILRICSQFENNYSLKNCTCHKLGVTSNITQLCGHQFSFIFSWWKEF